MLFTIPEAATARLRMPTDFHRPPTTREVPEGLLRCTACREVQATCVRRSPERTARRAEPCRGCHVSDVHQR
ncbi:hypothetical protein ASD51_22240 [Streptomyces sp. Root55]|nr:hypothetical protein ASD26_14735 [Streptomyces sp. Root1319]KQZ03132.1 hypothetical protein ASD51_22240 [Streptomyces sp. Root55]